MPIETIKFSQMTPGGDIANENQFPGLLGGGNVLFDIPWTFLPSGSTAERPAPSSSINYRLRFNTDDQLYEYYDAVLGQWTQLQENTFTSGPFITYTASGALPDAFNLGGLTSGIVAQNVSTGVSTPYILALPLLPEFGGTGVANAPNSTLTLGGATSFIGAYTVAFTFTGNTGVTFPTSGTLLTSASAATSITGTQNQVFANNTFGTMEYGDITLTLPQNIDQNAAVQFNSVQFNSTNGLLEQHGNIVLGIFGNIGSINNWNISNSTTGNSPNLYVTGTDTNINAGFLTKGVGNFIFSSANPLPIVIKSGTAMQHTTTLSFANTSASQIVTFPDATFTVAGTALALGGTNAALTATAGGIVYSNASSMAFTAAGTSGQLFQSAGTSAPGWTTSTYPSTNAANTLLYASSANTMAALATANNGVLITSNAGVPSWLANSGTPGYVLTANSGAPASWQAISASGAITTIDGDSGVITPSSGIVTISGGTTGLTTSGSSATLSLTGTLKLANGGTNASLTASNGGIFYSTATSGAILAGTPTAGQLLTSGASTTPSWTTSTYPATNAVNTLLYASSANVMAALATANSSVLITSSGGVPSLSTTLPSGIAASNMNLTTPRILSGGLTSATGYNWIGITETASAVNYINVTNNSATNSPSITFTGSDTNVIGVINAKGTGGVAIQGTSASTPANAAAGYVGELLSGTNATAVAMTSGSVTQINSLPLTAGDWDVWGVFYTTVGSGTVTTLSEAQLHTSSATIAAPSNAQLSAINGNYGTSTTTPVNINTGVSRWNVGSLTTVYLNAQVTYTTSTLTGNGNIYARRVR